MEFIPKGLPGFIIYVLPQILKRCNFNCRLTKLIPNQNFFVKEKNKENKKYPDLYWGDENQSDHPYKDVPVFVVKSFFQMVFCNDPRPMAGSLKLTPGGRVLR